jgi:hypothetical protein
MFRFFVDIRGVAGLSGGVLEGRAAFSAPIA